MRIPIAWIGIRCFPGTLLASRAGAHPAADDAGRTRVGTAVQGAAWIDGRVAPIGRHHASRARDPRRLRNVLVGNRDHGRIALLGSADQDLQLRRGNAERGGLAHDPARRRRRRGGSRLHRRRYGGRHRPGRIGRELGRERRRPAGPTDGTYARPRQCRFAFPEPVFSLQIWKCREIFTKCRVAPSAAQLKTSEFQ